MLCSDRRSVSPARPDWLKSDRRFSAAADAPI
jgi:hypothetical protein